nr:MAG TPA: hypothetical protein [Caudoviricetes sp.]
MNLTEATILALQGKLKLSEDVSVASNNESVVTVDSDKTTIFTPEETVTVEPVTDEAKIQEVLPEETKEEPIETTVEEPVEIVTEDPTEEEKPLTESKEEESKEEESISEKVLDYVKENGLEADFVLAFRKWIGTDKENEIKAYIVRENDVREYALEGFLPDEEEYKEIENMSDAEIYDKIEEENYMEQDEINALWLAQIEYQPTDLLNDFCSDYNRLNLDNELTNLEESKLAQDDTEEDTEDEAKEILNKIAASDSQKSDFVNMVKEEGTKRLNDIIIENVVETNDLRHIVDMENKELTDVEVFEKATTSLPSGPLVDMFFNVCLTLTENEDLIKLCKKYSKKYLVESEETNTTEEELEAEQYKSEKEEKSTVEEKLDKIIELLSKLVETPKTEEVLVANEKPVTEEPKEETETNVEEEKVDLKSFEERMLKKYNHIAKVEAVLKAPKAIALECLNKSGKKSRLIFTESKAGLYRTLSNIGLVVENKDNTLVCKRIIKNKRRK